MNKNLALGVCTALSILYTTASFADPGRDWPSRSGPNLDLTVTGGGVFDRPVFGLETLWTRELGSGYAGIVVAGERVITAFSDGHSDFLAAFSTENGDELWRYKIAETYAGHDGSSDGPLTTPSVDGSKVIGLGPWGHLFALSLEDGHELWAHRIDEDFGARIPLYGFSTHPTLVDGVLVVQGGGSQGRAISGFDPDTGKHLWSAEDATVNYQSPMALELGGKTQVFAATNQFIAGLKPKNGKLLWKHTFDRGPADGYSQPIPVDGDKVLLTDWPGSKLYQVVKSGGKYEVHELWRSRRLHGSYAIPVPYQGHLYGYAGNILSCVEAATGELVWRSREPGHGYVVLVDGHLVIQTDSGELVVAEATSEGYREKARAKVLERGYYNTPAFAGGQFYVRNLRQLTSVGVTDTPRPTPAPPKPEARGLIAGLLERLEAADDKAKLIDQFMASQKSFPIVEGDRLVHFVYRGEVEDLVLSGNFLQGAVVMQRAPGTDFYFHSVELEPASHYTYGFAVFDEPLADPLNPMKGQDMNGESNAVVTPGWQEPEHFATPTGERGQIHMLTWKSELQGSERKVYVYLPPGYERESRRYRVLFVNYGDQMLTRGKMNESLDNLIAAGAVEPLIAVFVPRVRYQEYASSQMAGFTRALVEELLAHVDRSYRTLTEPGSRAITGVATGATHAVYAALSRPDVFGAAAVQSFHYAHGGEQIKALIADGKRRDLDFYVVISNHDYATSEKESRELVELLEQHGYRPEVLEVGDGASWTSWGSRTDRVLAALFPKE